MTIHKLLDALEYEINLCGKTIRRLRRLQAAVREAAKQMDPGKQRQQRRKPKCPDPTTTT